ncbi:MAG: hypothetical protein ACREBE_01170 [bacterium]
MELCPECRIGAVVCMSCAALVQAPADPAQMQLFPAFVERVPTRPERPTLEERYWSLRAKASQAERRRYPYC